jgi:hypothetical protein
LIFITTSRSLSLNSRELNPVPARNLLQLDDLSDDLPSLDPDDDLNDQLPMKESNSFNDREDLWDNPNDDSNITELDIEEGEGEPSDDTILPIPSQK